MMVHVGTLVDNRDTQVVFGNNRVNSDIQNAAWAMYWGILEYSVRCLDRMVVVLKVYPPGCMEWWGYLNWLETNSYRS